MPVFREFIEREDFVGFIFNEFDKHEDGVPEKQSVKGKVWSAKKSDILQMWQKLRPDMPIIMTPMDTSTDTRSYGEDGVRITGSWNFISGVLSKLKDVIGYENPETKLRLVFRGVEARNDARPDRHSFVFYLNMDRRSKGRSGGRSNSFTPIKTAERT